MRHVLVSTCLLGGCAASGDVIATLPASGYVRVTVPTADVAPEAVTAVTVGGTPAYALDVSDGGLSVVVQGGAAGPAEVVVSTADADVSVGRVTYEPPVDPLFDRVVAYGASLTQGTRDAVPTQDAQLASPAMVVARAAGAALPTPLLADPLTPIMPSDVGADCVTPDTVSFIVSGVLDAVERLKDPVTGEQDLRYARVTPTLVPTNVAVGNAPIRFQRLGFSNRAEDVVAQMIARLTLEPEGTDLFATLDRTPMDWVLEAEPTLVLSFDLWGNDAIYALFSGGGPDTMTPVADVRAELEAQLELLEATGTTAVVAALPDVTVLPGLALTEAEADQVTSTVAAYNAAVREVADKTPWLFVAPLDDEVARIAEEGLVVDGETLTVDMFGGLLSLDGLHFTDTGYAMAANVVLRTLRDEVGVDVDEVPLAPVLAQDIRSPTALRDAGVPEKCFAGPPAG